MPKQLHGSATPEAASSVVPEFEVVDHGHGYPQIPQTPMFVWVFSPRRWQVLAGRVVPRLTKQPLEPGVNRIARTEQGRYLMADFRSRIEREGRLAIPFSWAPDGNSYLQALDTKPNPESPQIVKTYVSVFESAGAGDRATYPDVAGFADWLESLVAAGRLPACSPTRLRRMLEEASGRRDTAEVAYSEKPSAVRKQRLAAFDAEVKALEEALSKHDKAAASASRAAGKARRAKATATPDEA